MLVHPRLVRNFSQVVLALNAKLPWAQLKKGPASCILEHEAAKEIKPMIQTASTYNLQPHCD